MPVRFRPRAITIKTTNMININDKLNKRSITLFIIGIVLFLLSFLLIYFIGQNPEGIIGFLAPITMLISIIVIVYGLLSKKQ